MEKNKNVEKKKNIWIYFIKMSFLFLLIFIGSQLAMKILQSSFTYLKYGPEIIMQSIWAVIIVLVVFSFKNGYVFKQKSEKILPSLKLGWPLLAVATIYLILNIVTGIVEGAIFDIPTILNLATYCLLIGVVEELLCRGWLLNEFLERFSDSKKNILISIILSSVIFGFIHIFNALVGQSFAETLVQILNATLLGIMFGLIYYKTKNIWSIILIHAIWDFCVMIGQSTVFVDCVPGTITNSIIIYLVIVSIIILLSMGLICYWLYKQTDLNEKKNPLTEMMYYVLPIIGIIIYMSVDMFPPKDYEEYYICPTYETKVVGTEFEVQYYSHSKYNLNYSKEENYSFSLSVNEETYLLEFINNNTNEKIELMENMAADYILIENENSYVILVQTAYNKVLYGLYSKENITNDKEYLEQVKIQLKEYVVPDINSIGSVTFGDSDYKYGQIQTVTYDKLYFDKNGQLYIATIE